MERMIGQYWSEFVVFLFWSSLLPGDQEGQQANCRSSSPPGGEEQDDRYQDIQGKRLVRATPLSCVIELDKMPGLMLIRSLTFLTPRLFVQTGTPELLYEFIRKSRVRHLFA